MDSRKPLDMLAMGLMVTVCLIWGLQQIILKATADDISPVLQIGLRSGIAAVLVGLFMVVRRERLSFANGTWKPGLVIGLLFGFEFLLVGEGLRYTSASHMVVFLYTAPIFAALGLHWKLPSERLSIVQWIGIAAAFGGIAIAFLGRTPQAAGSTFSTMLYGDALALMAGMTWGATTVVVRSTALARMPATQTLLYQLVAAFVILCVAAVVLGQDTFHPTPRALLSLAFHSVVVSFISFLVWFWLLRHYLASRLGVLSFMTPLFGVILGAWLLDETISPSFMAGAALVLIGIVVVSGHGWLRQAAGYIGRRRKTV